ncbi:hypothetical protein [Bradyrhizobium sp. WSM1743]|uniref:hypothetical protein n=1 Tax=Bradyrhizobium sp. WSM1743 TaxID=318996 RepID=UPI0004830E47|nr:hypothetical protein [Bradyrhizobium sp. WSM1743]
MSPAPVGAHYQPIRGISVTNETQEPLIGRFPSDRGGAATLKRDGLRKKRYRALGYCLSMIFSENRCALFRIML